MSLFLKKHIDKIILFVSVLVVMIVFFMLHNLYPFGSNLLMINDDGYQQHLPLLYYYYDVLHGTRSAFFDWDAAYGTNMAGVLSHFGLLSPINLLYLFISRDQVAYASNYMLALRILLLAFSFRFFLKSTFKDRLSDVFVILLSILYCFNTYTVHYIYFTQWIDVAILLPVCMVALNRLLREGICCRRYALLLALLLIINMQQDYSVFLFLIIYSGLMVYFAIPDVEERKKAVFRLGVYTVLAIALSSFVLFPAAYQMGTSSRLSGNILYKIKEVYRSNANPETRYNEEKWKIFSSSVLPLLFSSAVIIWRRIRKRHVDRELVAFVVLSVLMVLPVIVESINLVWQGGSYISYPYRCGYLMELAVLLLFAQCLTGVSKFCDNRIKQCTGAGVSIIIVLFTVLLASQVTDYGDITKEDSLVNPGIEAYRGASDYHPLIRSKSEDYLDNYSLISGIPSVNSYLHLFPAEILSANQSMGYYQDFTKPSGKGGTRVTDMITCFDSCWIGYYDGALDALSDDLFDNQNRICRGFLGEELFTEYQLDGADMKIDIPLDKEYEIYVYYPDDEEPYLENMGIFDGTFHFEREYDRGGEIRIGLLDINEYEQIVPKTTVSSADIRYTSNSLKFAVSNEKEYDRVLFMPIAALNGWSLSINGKESDIITIFDSFIGIRVPASKSVEIRLEYVSPYLSLGILLSAIGIFLLLLDYRFCLCDRIMLRPLKNVAYLLFFVAFWGILFGAYFINILFSLLDSKYWYFLLQKHG